MTANSEVGVIEFHTREAASLRSTTRDEELSAVLLSSLLGEKRMVLGRLVELSGKEESGPNNPYPTKGLKKEEQTEGHVA